VDAAGAAGDREALEDLRRRVQPSLHGYLARLARASDAHDLLQRVLIIGIRTIGDFEDPALFRPWIPDCQPRGADAAFSDLPLREAAAIFDIPTKRILGTIELPSRK